MQYICSLYIYQWEGTIYCTSSRDIIDNKHTPPTMALDYIPSQEEKGVVFLRVEGCSESSPMWFLSFHTQQRFQMKKFTSTVFLYILHIGRRNSFTGWSTHEDASNTIAHPWTWLIHFGINSGISFLLYQNRSKSSEEIRLKVKCCHQNI